MTIHGGLLVVLGLVSATADDDRTSLPPPANRAVDFDRDVRPIFDYSCVGCHGSKKRKGGLALHAKAFGTSGGDDGPVIVPGKPLESRLLRYVAGLEDDHRMPPEGGGKPLTAEQVAILRAWIEQGAAWPDDPRSNGSDASDHWAFRRPIRPSLPEVRHPTWARNPIDRFVLARLDRERLEPSPEADRSTLIRRLTLDLIGLPPTIAEVDAFLGDRSPDAYERLVDRLLASPHYGERWARRWLDGARYADTNGYEKDRERSIWPYRDWVIRALNDDMPFDQFTIEQVAGDLLPDASTSRKVATGFHRNTMINEEGGIDVEEFRFASLVDRVATTGAVWLGLTIQCAQCHTHKYDPITQREYYRFLAFLDNVDEPDLELHDPAIARRRAEVERQIRALEDGLAGRFPGNLEGRRDQWEEGLKPTRWATIAPTSTVSAGHATMTILDDRSVLVTGDKPNNDTYRVVVPVSGPRITAIRVEVLPDESLPEGGPGRAPLFSVGNFFLSDFRAELTASDGATARKLAIRDASADFEEPGKPASGTLDGKTDTGWSIGGAVGRAHAIVFRLKEPIETPPGSKLTLTLQQMYIHQTTIGRFRVSTTADVDPPTASGLPAEVEAIALIRPSDRSPEQASAIERYFLSVAPELAKANAEIAALRKSMPRFPTSMVLRERSAPEARTTHVHRRGEFLRLAEVVTPGVPAVLAPLPEGTKPDRLALARWLAAEENPLVARVAVNRAWQAFFGRGLVATLDDFGTRGERPTHPELLDWLATEFPRLGWSQKALHRLIVTSATYRQGSKASKELLARDPRNECLARGPRFRVEYEMVRDIALAASGLLDSKVGGPSVFPPQPEGVTSLAYGQTAWPTSKGPDRYRRGLYTYTKRTAPFAASTTFDAPNSEVACVRRERSNTPLQALTLLNDPAFVEASVALGRRLMAEGPPDPEGKARLAFRLCVGREPLEDEVGPIVGFRSRQIERLKAGELKADAILGAKSSENPTELASWASVARALLNLDEAITKE